MIEIPKRPNTYSNPVWDQSNNSDINGSLWASFNLDLSENEGKLRLGKRLIANTVTADDSNLNSYPIGFRNQQQSGSTARFMVAGSYIWSTTDPTPEITPFTKITSGGTPPSNCDSTLSDIELFNNNLYVTTQAVTVYYLPVNSTTWASIAPGDSGAGAPRPLCVYGNRMYLGTQSYSGTNSGVISWDTSNTIANSGAYTIQIGDNQSFIITFLRSASNRIWIGTVNTVGGKGYIYEWDGTATQPTKSYRLESSGALSCVIKNDIPYVMDSNGVLLAWNGGTFTEISRLNRRNKKILYNATSASNNRFIHPNGMSVINGKINILIDGRNYDNTTASSDSIEETIPSGIWEYDENRGLTHKHSIATGKSADTIKDYGQVKIAGVGALTESNYASTVSGRNGTLVCGASYYSDATTVKSGVFYDDSNDTLQKAGYFVTTKIFAQDQNSQSSIQNTWQNIYVLFRKLLDATDKIVVKYRIIEADPTEATITWTSSTTFTTTTDISAYWTSGLGGEVEILNGVGAGVCSHITGYTLNAGTYTVTVDETHTGATGTAKARFQSWKKLGSDITSTQATYEQIGIGDISNWIQFKVWMLFTGKDDIQKLILINFDSNPAN